MNASVRSGASRVPRCDQVAPNRNRNSRQHLLVAQEMQQTVYAPLHGAAIALPANPKSRPEQAGAGQAGRERNFRRALDEGDGRGRRGHRGGLFQQQPSHKKRNWTAGALTYRWKSPFEQVVEVGEQRAAPREGASPGRCAPTFATPLLLASGSQARLQHLAHSSGESARCWTQLPCRSTKLPSDSHRRGTGDCRRGTGVPQTCAHGKSPTIPKSRRSRAGVR